MPRYKAYLLSGAGVEKSRGHLPHLIITCLNHLGHILPSASEDNVWYSTRCAHDWLRSIGSDAHCGTSLPSDAGPRHSSSPCPQNALFALVWRADHPRATWVAREVASQSDLSFWDFSNKYILSTLVPCSCIALPPCSFFFPQLVRISFHPSKRSCNHISTTYRERTLP